MSAVASEKKQYRITRTTIQKEGYWEGLCAVVERRQDSVVFPNGDAYPCMSSGRQFKITAGPHKGEYDIKRLK